MLMTDEAAQQLWHLAHCTEGSCICNLQCEGDLAPIRNVLFDLVYTCADVADKAEQEGLESGSNAVRRVMGEQ